MKKKITIILLTAVMALSGCSSIPKQERVVRVTTVRKQAAVLLERGHAEYRWDGYDSSLNQYRNAFLLASSVDWQEGIVRSLVHISRSLDRLGRTEEALAHVSAASELLEADSPAELRVLVLNRTAEWYFLQGNRKDAGTAVQQALTAGEGITSQETGETWRIKAALHKRAGEYDQALAAVESAAALDEKGGFIAELASDYYIRASVLSLTGDSEGAAASMMQALEKDKFIENTPGIAQDLYGLGRIYEKAGDSDNAVLYFKRAYLVYKGSGKGTVPEKITESLETLTGSPWWITETEKL